MRTERELLADVLGRLNLSGVDYMLTGSMASNFWGIPRTTHDLDFVLVMQPSQVPALVSAFAEGSLSSPTPCAKCFAHVTSSTPLMHNPR